MAETQLWYLDNLWRQKSSTVYLSTKGYNGLRPFGIRGFTNDSDYGFSITNQFNNASVSSLFSKLRDKFNDIKVPLARNGALLDRAINVATDFLNSEGSGGSDDIGFEDSISKALASVQTMLGTLNKYLNKSIEIADDYIYTYNGTTIEVPTSFKAVLVADKYNIDSSEDPYVTLNHLLQHCVTDLKVIEGSEGLVGAQDPPNGYEMNLDALTKKTIKGTWSLTLSAPTSGRSTAIIVTGLVISSLNVNVSRVKVRTSLGDRPLFIELEIGLQLVRKMTRSDITQFFPTKYKGKRKYGSVQVRKRRSANVQ